MTLRKRNERNIEYLSSDGRWLSTGTKDMNEAKKYVKGINGTKITLSDFADDMFTSRETGSYYDLCIKSGRGNTEFWWDCAEKRYQKYIRPFFKSMQIAKITAPTIQNWYLTMEKYSRGNNISASTRNKNLNILHVIFKHALFLGHVTSDPTVLIMKMPEVNEHKVPFTEKELKKMFPDDIEDLKKIWSNLTWACYFMVMRDTGWRPGEIAGLDFSGLFLAKNGIYTEQSVDSYTKKVKNSIKTTKSGGYTYKVGLLSPQTVRTMCIMISESGNDKGLVFRNTKGGIITNASSEKAFKTALEKLNLPNRPPYSLRTTFFSLSAQTMNEEVLKELMGHTKWRSCYDARTPEQIISKISGILSNDKF